MPDGFKIQLEDYCSWCGEFKPEVEKNEITTLGDRISSCYTAIKCKNAYKCARLAENMRNREVAE